MAMTGHERRATIVQALHGAARPIRGTELASRTGVSRQAIVQDIALLRADGHDIVATNRGYVLREAGAEPQVPTRLVKVRHTVEELPDELRAIVDKGGAVTNVMVNHRAYGKITADLDISSRRDIDRYLEAIRSGKSTPLMAVTSGYHFHRIVAESEEILDEIEAELAARGYVAELLPYEVDGLDA